MEGVLSKKKSITKANKGKSISIQTKSKSNFMKNRLRQIQTRNISRKKISKYYQSSKLNQRKRENQINNTQDPIQAIHKSFNMFFCKKLDFNQFVAALKYIGVSIQSEQDFEKMFHIYNQQNQQMTINRYILIAVQLLNQIKQKKLTCQQICLKKAYYYILEQGNGLNRFINIQQNVKDSDQQQQVLESYKKQVQKLPKQARYINLQTLKNIRNYLNRKDICDKDLEDIFSYQNRGEKTYISQQDCILMINYNKIM